MNHSGAYEVKPLQLREFKKAKGKRSPAFPVPKLNGGEGMTLYEWAAVMLKVPESGNERLDAMIRKSQ